ncbi:MAG: aminopeptidase [Faecalibacterium sp.]|nr:aminopeptidase [Ruminococcus sp.]MCM1391206.1 aminopeptidase [Ruminococcus sp.]MCM1485666.1 aminopeptidase [Faecalibacterium sp.]
MNNEKSEAELLQEKLCLKKEHFDRAFEGETEKADEFCKGYMEFLGTAKTERECNAYIIEKAKQNGFVEFDCTKKYSAGDKVYVNNRNKAVILAVIGQKGVSEGAKIVASHIDSPRLDLKPTPLYEDNELAYFKTHYYGGLRKYQWAAIPLSLHGVFVKKDGSTVTVSLGEKEGEPQFVITDLLPHLAKEQCKRTLSEGIKGEELNILVGSRPFKSDKGSEMVKLNILKLLNEKYGIVESDFVSAELELVPAFKVSDIGFDRSLIGAYGHDDRVCAYPGFEALFSLDVPEHTAIMVLADKEEIGSMGNTGLNSAFLKYFIADLAEAEGLKGRHAISKSECLSADVNAGFDPNFPSVMDKNNAAYLNHGVVVTKYTGSRGKSGTSDAHAEFLGKVRSIMDNAGVCWQIGEMGKVDEGGGGTVAMFVANLNIDVVDLGVPVLSMHAPFEIVAKADVYSTYKACEAFFKS